MPVLQTRPKLGLPFGNYRIDWSHPIAEGLVAAYLPGISAFDLCGLQPRLSVNTGTTFGVGVDGPGYSDTNSAAAAPGSPYDYSIPSGNIMLGYSNLTLFFRAYQSIAGDGIDNNLFMGLISNGAPFHIADIDSSGGHYEWNWNSAGTSNNVIGTIAAAANGQVFDVGGVFQVGGNVSGYVNGILDVTKAFGASVPTSGTPIFSFGNATGSFLRYSGAIIFAGYVWNRALTATEIAWLHLEPYCFLISAESEMPSLFVSGYVPYDPWPQWAPVLAT